MKKLILVVVCVLSLAGLSYGNGISWASGSGYITYASGGANYLDGNLSSSLGCFAQLLWVGPNNTIDSAYNTGSGAGVGTSDDVVVDKNWVGNNNGDDGWWSFYNDLPESGSIVSGRTYYVRVWSAPASDYASGLVPTSLTNRYVNSGTWLYSSIAPTYDIVDPTASGNLATTLTPLAIPEPAVFGLGIVGLISLRLFGRKRKS